jgi:hypothetical protein
MKSTKSDYFRLKNQLKKVDYFGQKNKLKRPALHMVCDIVGFLKIQLSKTNYCISAWASEHFHFMLFEILLHAAATAR